MEQTLAILKPDCVRRGLVGEAVSLIEAEGFRIAAMRLIQLSDAQARRFYDVHKTKGFFEDLIAFMTSAPCIVMVLERDHAVAHWRQVLERFRQANTQDLTENLVHGSDAPETSDTERRLLFAGIEVYGAETA